MHFQTAAKPRGQGSMPRQSREAEGQALTPTRPVSLWRQSLPTRSLGEDERAQDEAVLGRGGDLRRDQEFKLSPAAFKPLRKAVHAFGAGVLQE